MGDINYIFAYYQKIKDGSVTVGRWVRLIYEYIIDGLEQKAFFFDQKKANAAVDWIEAHAFHTEGPLAPGPFLPFAGRQSPSFSHTFPLPRTFWRRRTTAHS